MLHDFFRYLLLIAVITTSVYGVMHFRGSNLRSSRYVTRPDSRLWTPFRLFSDDEWTADGLIYRRRLLTWWVVSVVLLLVLISVW